MTDKKIILMIKKLPDKNDVSIIIVNYNGKDLLQNCLESIYKNTASVRFEVIVVDNASADDSVDMIQNCFKEVVLVASDSNLGFGQANNTGVQKATGKYLLILNSDTILLNNSVKVFFDFMENSDSDKIGAIGGELLDFSGSITHSYARLPSMLYTCKVTIGYHVLSLKPLSKLRDRLLNNSKPKPIKNPIQVGYVTGADLFIRRDLFMQFHGFDPAFFMYGEEADLQKRLADAGYQRLIIPGTRIVHLEGSTSNKARTTKNYHYYKSLFTYFKLHNPKLYYLLFRAFFSLLPKVPI